MFKSQDILLISIIIILIIVICHCKKGKREGFISNDIFNQQNLADVSTKIDDEKAEIIKIKSDFETIIKREKDQYYVNDVVTNTYREATTKDLEEGKLEIKPLSALVDIENMVKMNANMGEKLKEIPYPKYYDETSRAAVQARITNVNNAMLLQKQTDAELEVVKNKLAIKNIKHIDTSVMYDLEKIGASEENTYKIKDKNDTLPNSDANNNGNNKTCGVKCLAFDTDKFNDDTDDYISFEDCIDNNAQQLSVNNIKLDYKCYDIEGGLLDTTNKTLEECSESLYTYLKYDKDSYVDNYNKLLPTDSPLKITENQIPFLPDDFVAITPKNQPANAPPLCLTVDSKSVSFQDCDLRPHQRFNYERGET